MFEVKINKNKYYVFGEKEFTIYSEPKSPIIPCPNYYSLKILNGKYPITKFTNIEPVIINELNIELNNPFNINISFGMPLTTEEYEILYELYLKQSEENQTEEYLQEKNIKNDIETAKILIKKERK